MCEFCDYSSDRKGDVSRHTSSRHPQNEGTHPYSKTGASTSKDRRTPPKAQRKNSVWPSLHEILGSPCRAADLTGGDEVLGKSKPPTPVVTPLTGVGTSSQDATQEQAEKGTTQQGEVLNNEQHRDPCADAESSREPKAKVNKRSQPDHTEGKVMKSARASPSAETETANENAAEVVQRAASDAGRPMSIAEGQLKQRLATVVLPDGRIFVTNEQFVV